MSFVILSALAVQVFGRVWPVHGIVSLVSSVEVGLLGSEIFSLLAVLVLSEGQGLLSELHRIVVH